MIHDARITQALYRRLLTLYPREFRDQLAESMEQTFKDLCDEKRQAKEGLFGFVLWTFIETAIGIVRERLLLFTEGDSMQTTIRTFGVSGSVSFLLTLPFIIMEIVNRRHLNEDFPFALFFALWLNLFAVSLILLPILRARRTGDHDLANPAPTQGNTLLTNPTSALMISLGLILFIGLLSLLASAGWEQLERLVNGPNPEVAYLPGQIISLIFVSIPIAAGIIAGGPIVRTMRAGGSLFAHPIHLIMVVVISFLFMSGVVSLIMDQWPCFIGVPVCD